MTVNYSIVLITIVLQLLQNIIHGASPIKKCSLQDSVCLTTQARTMVQSFADGFPKLGIEKLDKLEIGDENINIGYLNYNTMNMEVQGLQNASIDNVRIDLNLKKIFLHFHTTFEIRFDYDINGTFVSLPVFGKGNCTRIEKNVRVNIIFWFDIVKNDNGKSFMNISRYAHGFDIRDGKEQYCDNLYDGKDKAKSEYFHGLLNENWLTVAEITGKLYFERIVDRIFNGIKLYMAASALEDIAIY